MQTMVRRRTSIPIDAAMADIRAAHPECARWYRIAALPRYLIGQCADGTYRAFSLDDVRDAVNVYPMPNQLIALTPGG